LRVRIAKKKGAKKKKKKKKWKGGFNQFFKK